MQHVIHIMRHSATNTNQGVIINSSGFDSPLLLLQRSIIILGCWWCLGCNTSSRTIAFDLPFHRFVSNDANGVCWSVKCCFTKERQREKYWFTTVHVTYARPQSPLSLLSDTMLSRTMEINSAKHKVSHQEWSKPILAIRVALSHPAHTNSRRHRLLNWQVQYCSVNSGNLVPPLPLCPEMCPKIVLLGTSEKVRI
jgi:hypothetical protein